MAPIPVPDPYAELPAGRDFYRLRREGIDHIAEAGSDLWTDFNTHDPGITMLEALAYAITDLSYRAGFPVEDILATAAVGTTADDPYPDQAFFSPRRILTVNPVTPADLRRLLIDADAVRNAWVRCDASGCTPSIPAWCEDGALTLSWDPSQRRDEHTEVFRIEPRGLYTVLLELEADPDLGELGDRKIVRRRSVRGDFGRLRFLTMELRFPEWGAARSDERRALARAETGSYTVTAGPLTRTTTGTAQVDDDELRRHWNDLFRLDLRIDLADGTTVAIENASLRLFGDGSVRRTVEVGDVLTWLADASSEGFVEPYRAKIDRTDAAIRATRALLEAHRNLDEDWGCVRLAPIAEIAVCAEIEVDPAIDIDLVQARVWFTIERYLDPPVRFASLAELAASGVATDAAFCGPELENGFITDDVLLETDMRSQLRASDLLDLLMEVDGVLAVSGLLLTAYDEDGAAIPGIADPDRTSGAAVFDRTRTSASWLLELPPDHRARLHRGLSRFSFTSAGLPFSPRLGEAEDTLVQLRGATARPKLRAGDMDVRPPAGTRRRLDAYRPVQHSLPQVYGIGTAGLPSTASTLRRAQAKQLKAYLMVFEQLLLNAHAQLAHAPDLFSLAREVERTYFAGDLAAAFPAELEQRGVDGLSTVAKDTLTPALVGELAESRSEYLERRNRFLDHLLARFGESFREHVMAQSDLEGRSKSRLDLIRDKLALLRALPRIGHDRGKAFDRSVSPTDPDNSSGLQQRVQLLLGLPDWTIAYRAHRSASTTGFEHALTLDELGEPIIEFDVPDAVATALSDVLVDRGLDAGPRHWRIEGADGTLHLETTVDSRTTSEPLLGPGASSAARALGTELARVQRSLLQQATLRERYGMHRVGAVWRVNLHDADGARVAQSIQLFTSRQRAGSFISLASTWSAHKRAILVEHLLLRPKFPGDALSPVCTDGADCCGRCCHEDPYSFRLTYVMPGWTEPFSSDMSMRGFADRTIQEQAPSHLVVKTCWVADDGFVSDPCDPVVDRIAEALRHRLGSADDRCRCAADIYAACAGAFGDWLGEQAAAPLAPASVPASLRASLAGVDLSGTCASELDETGREALLALLVEHFTDIALRGRQFERFESAWSSWAEAEAGIDWTQERLLDAVVELLAAASTSAGATPDAVHACAQRLLDEFGAAFREWMDAGLEAGGPLDGFAAFDPPEPVPCASLGTGPGVGPAIRALLLERYARYAEVSHRLSQLTQALGALRSAYPQATLHDCDDGSDSNPVRLGRTALGSN